MIQSSDEEIMRWYELVQQYYKGNYVNKGDFCKKNNLLLKQFQNWCFRLNNIKYVNEDEYNKRVGLTKKYLASGEKVSDFISKNDINPTHLSQVVTHLKYLEIIFRCLQNPMKQPERSMSFIKMRPMEPIPRWHDTPTEIVEQQNDIEIIISKGVKVSISPNIDSMKIIKIIELLKDL